MLLPLNTNTNTNDFVNDFVVSLPDLTTNTTTNDFVNEFVVSLPDPTSNMHTNMNTDVCPVKHFVNDFVVSPDLTTNTTTNDFVNEFVVSLPDPTSNMHTNANTDVCPVKHNTNTNTKVLLLPVVMVVVNTNNVFVNEPPKLGHFDKIKKLKFLTGSTMTTTLYWGYLQPFCKGEKDVYSLH